MVDWSVKRKCLIPLSSWSYLCCVKGSEFTLLLNVFITKIMRLIAVRYLQILREKYSNCFISRWNNHIEIFIFKEILYYSYELLTSDTQYFSYHNCLKNKQWLVIKCYNGWCIRNRTSHALLCTDDVNDILYTSS
jgi:hypothetical protein